MNPFGDMILNFIHSRMIEIGGGLLILGLLAAVFFMALVRANRKLAGSYNFILYAFVNSLEARDRYSAGHSLRVAEYSKLIARRLGIERKKADVIYQAAMLHDIGKIGIQDSILLKTSKLTLEEMDRIKAHPHIASSILRTAKTLYHQEIEIIEAHHERWDGEGYPRGLKGDEIPLGARIIAVADSYDAMTSDRPYRTALSSEKALSEIAANSGTQFDPGVTTALADIDIEELKAFSRSMR